MSLWSGRAFRLLTVLVIANTVGFGASLVLGQRWPAALSWTLLPVIAGLAAFVASRVPVGENAPPTLRRYWRITVAGLATFSVTLLLRLADALSERLSLGPFTTVLHLIGGVLLMAALYQLPLIGRTRSSRAVVTLDVGTLMVATGVLTFHFAVLPLFQADRVTAGDVLKAVTLMGAGMGTVQIAAKIAMSGVATMSRRSLAAVGVSAVIGALASAIGLLLTLGLPTNPMVLLLPFAAFTVAMSARFQMIDTAAAEVDRERRGYSLMPYLAVAVVSVMLVVTAVTDAPDHLIVVGFAVAIIALVILRQLIAFRQHDALLQENHRQRERLSYEARHDALTGLANRVLFGSRLAGATTRDLPFCLALVDLDDFKEVNDTLGHAVGDALLVHVAERMTDGVRPVDTVARLGGDEFAILFEGVTETRIGAVLSRISHALLEPAVIEGELLSVKASFGVVQGRPGDNADHLLRRADIAMYEAKQRGEGGHQVYQPGMEARGAERSRLAAELRRAIAGDQLVLHYQPEVTLPEGRIVGAEALVRWQHPERGLLGPGAFVDNAEQTGLIVPMGRWVLREATRQAAVWAAGPDDPIGISVNASARQLRDPGFPGEVASALRDSGLPARLLTLEITESTAVGGGATQQTLNELREMGVRLSLDDFGTGASTLSLLATCPVDEIKLDRSFVPSPGTEAIATAVRQLARAFGVVAVAEGVETAEQAERLAALGYNRAQGFHFARPIPADQLSGLLRNAASTAAVSFSR